MNLEKLNIEGKSEVYLQIREKLLDLDFNYWDMGIWKEDIFDLEGLGLDPRKIEIAISARLYLEELTSIIMDLGHNLNAD